MCILHCQLPIALVLAAAFVVGDNQTLTLRGRLWKRL